MIDGIEAGILRTFVLSVWRKRLLSSNKQGINDDGDDDDDDDDDDNNNNNNNSYTWNITHNTESTAVWSLKPERWGSSLVQEKYQEEKACDKRRR